MFTFSFGSALAAISPSAKATLLEAEKLALTRAEGNFDAVYASLENTYNNIGVHADGYEITDEAWATVKTDAWKAYKKVITDITDNFDHDPTATTAAGMVDEVYVSGGDSILTATFIQSWLYTNCLLDAARSQMAIDKQELIDRIDAVDFSLYSKTTPSTGDTYYELAVKRAEALKDVVKGYDETDEVAYQNVMMVKSAMDGLNAAIYAWTPALTIGTTGIESGLYKINNGTGYATELKTIEEEATADLDAEVVAAKVKAVVKENYVNYLKGTTADKDLAEAYLTVYYWLADQGVITTAGDVESVTVAPDFTTAVGQVEELNAYAAKYKAEKNANGELVRDAATIDKIVKTATTDIYAKAENSGYTDGARTLYVLGTAKTAIEDATVETTDANLVFAKEVAKVAAEDAREDALENYYPKEQEAVNAAYDKYIAAVEAATVESKIPALSTVTYSSVLTKTQVNTLYTSGKLATAYDTLYDADADKGALELYLDYKNAGLTARDAAYIVSATLDTDLQKYLGEKGARTADEVKALAEEAKSVVDALPTVGGIAAAKAAVEEAIKAIPATVTVADKDAVENAWNLAKDYADMTNASGADYTAQIAATDISNRATLATKIDKLHSAMALDLAKKSAAAGKTDKAALNAVQDEIDAFNDLHDAEEMFENGTEYTDTTVSKALEDIRAAELKAVISAINVLPVNITDADKAAVENARKLYDAFVKEYTDYDAPGYNAAAQVTNFRELALAEAALGLNYDAEENAKAYVQDLKIAARSVKTSKGVKVTINADVQPLLDEGFTVEYKFYRSTKSNKNFGTAKVTKTENTYLNTAGKKGTRYYYKAKLVVKNAAGEVVATTPLTQCLYATRTF